MMSRLLVAEQLRSTEVIHGHFPLRIKRILFGFHRDGRGGSEAFECINSDNWLPHA